MNSTPYLSNGIIIDDKFRIVCPLGEGSFGQIYAAKCIFTGQNIAIKVERKDCAKPLIPIEAKIYRKLGKTVGIPRFYYNGSHGNLNFLAIEQLGPSLYDLFKFCGFRFSLKTVMMLYLQIIGHFAFIHAKGVLHRDIKPANFLMGIDSNAHKVYVVDFGLAKVYRHPKTGAHLMYRDKKNFCGTIRYASLNSHMGIEQARRDDMESLVYVMLLFLKGSLPWQDVSGITRKQKYEKIREIKMSAKIFETCNDVPQEILVNLKYIRSLAYDEAPDYELLYKSFCTLCVKRNIKTDYMYDWIIRPKSKSLAISCAKDGARDEDDKDDKNDDDEKKNK